MRKGFDISQNWTVAEQGADLEMTTPTRPAGFVSDLVVPLGQALITGAFAAGLIVFILSEVGPDWEINRLKAWGFLALAISAVTWLILLVDTRKLLRQFEKLTGLDLDGDGTAGEPDPAKRVFEVHVHDGQGYTRIVESEWLGIDDDRLIAFSVGIANGRNLTEATWSKDRAIFPEGINSFRAFRSKLEEAGLIALVNPKAPNLGYEPTAAGRAFFRRMAEMAEYSHTHTHEAQG